MAIVPKNGPLKKGCTNNYCDEAASEDHLSCILGQRSMLRNSFGQKREPFLLYGGRCRWLSEGSSRTGHHRGGWHVAVCHTTERVLGGGSWWIWGVGRPMEGRMRGGGERRR